MEIIIMTKTKIHSFSFLIYNKANDSSKQFLVISENVTVVIPFLYGNLKKTNRYGYQFQQVIKNNAVIPSVVAISYVCNAI